jgi:hypothetical protein
MWMNLATLLMVGLVSSGCINVTYNLPSKKTPNSVLSGVAATGAPISNGVVVIKDKTGKAAPGELTTDRDGKYGANVQDLEPPFIIQVTSAAGEKLISVATGADVAQSRKVNVTPLSYIVVANVFGDTDPDSLVSQFATRASNMANFDNQVAEKKEQLQTALSAVMTGLGIPVVDIINGDLKAGTSQGLDRLLDAIQVRPGTGNMEIRFKGNDDVIVTSSPTSSNSNSSNITSGISTINAQLSELDKIKQFFKNLTTTYNHYTKLCKGPVDPNRAECAPTKIHQELVKYLHPDYKWTGMGRDEDLWEWFCEEKQNGEWVTNAQDCTRIKDQQVEFDDVTILELNADAAGGPEAHVTINLYMNGELRAMEVDYLKKDPTDESKWKLFGDQRNYRVWIESNSKAAKIYSQSGNLVDTIYQMVLSTYVDDQNFSGATDISIAFVKQDNTIDTQLMQEILRVNGNPDTRDNGGIALALHNNGYYTHMGIESKLWNENELNEDSSRIIYDRDALAKMNLKHKVAFSYTIGDTAHTEYFYVSRPREVTASNEAQLMPSFAYEAQLCSERVSRPSYAVTAPLGTSLSWGSAHIWVESYVVTAQADLDGRSGSFELFYGDAHGRITEVPYPIEGPLLPGYWYIGSEDLSGARFRKEVRCMWDDG